MCLAVPGKLVEWLDREPLLGRAVVEFAGVRRTVSMGCVPEADLDDFVLVHAGVAICRIDEEQAAQSLAALEELGLLDADESDPQVAGETADDG